MFAFIFNSLRWSDPNSDGTDPITYPSSSWTGATQPGELYRIVYTATDGSLVGTGVIARNQSVGTIQFVPGATAHAVTYSWSIGATTGTAGITLTLSNSTSATCSVQGTYNGAITVAKTANAEVTVTVTDAVNGALIAIYTDTVNFTWTAPIGG